MKSSNLDINFVRKQFPKKCWEWAFFENAGGSFVPNSVINRMTEYMAESQVQPGEHFPMAQLAQERINSGHKLMAALIGAQPDEVIIGASTSMNVYVLAKALRPLWNEGDEVIVSVQNHEANSGPWRRLAETGIKVINWPVDPETGDLQATLLPKLLTSKTRLVAFPHVSNITGTFNDVKALTTIVHDAGAMVCVDGVAYAPHRAIDVKRWDVDFYLFSFYKMYGPHIGCLYGKKTHLLAAKGQYHYFVNESETAKKLNPAGPCHETIASLVGIADYFSILAKHHLNKLPNSLFDQTNQIFKLFAIHEEVLAKTFIEFLESKRTIRLLGLQNWEHYKRAPTFSFTVEHQKSAYIPPLLLSEKIAVGHGNFYAKRLIEAAGIQDSEDGVIRVSMAHYNSTEEVERLISSLDRAL